MDGLKQYIDKTLVRYQERFKMFGDDPRSLDWASKKSQEIRFREMVKIGCLDKKSILDVGCGLGDFYAYLRDKLGLMFFEYTGIDIVPEFTNLAKSKYGGSLFKCCDLFGYEGQPDYVFMIDVVDTLVEDNWRIIKGMLARAFRVARIAVGASFLSSYAPPEDIANSDQYYVQPEELFRFCKTLTPWVVMKHEYLPHNVMIWLYREQQRGGE